MTLNMLSSTKVFVITMKVTRAVTTMADTKMRTTTTSIVQAAAMTTTRTTIITLLVTKVNQ